MKWNNISLFYCLALFFAISLSACGGDDDVDCKDAAELTDSLLDELNAVSEANTAYAADMSTENCDALKAAYQAYIDAIKELQHCANEVGVGDEFQSDLEEAEMELASVC